LEKNFFFNFDFIFQEKTGKIFIFPDGNDIKQHKYASSNCSTNGNNDPMKENNGLCTCAPGYTFVDKTSPCRKIIFHDELFNKK
jgi:hypothetical protein